MTLTRRVVLQGALLAVTAPVATRARAWSGRERGAPPPDVRLLVCDQRLAASRLFGARQALPVIDVATEEVCCWRGLRRHRVVGAVAGLTNWSDWVQVRGFLQEQGLRKRVEQRRGRLFYWEMV